MNGNGQTLAVMALAVAIFSGGLIAANETALGITSPLITLVGIPTALTAFGLAMNQLKTIGANDPGTIVTHTVTTLPVPQAAPPPPPVVPPTPQ